MPKPIPAADDLTRPFWDAANEERLLVHHCTSCDELQFPPRPRCRYCGADTLDWREVPGRGRINTCQVVYDGRVGSMQGDQPFNLAVITLDADPRINMYSNLPGVPAHEAPIDAPVEVIFEAVSPGQKVPEWRVVA